MGGESEQLESSRIHSQLEVLPVRVHRRLHNSTLPISKADDLSLEQTKTGRAAHLLQHEMTKRTSKVEPV